MELDFTSVLIGAMGTAIIPAVGILSNYGIERLKARNDKKIHISKTRFDKEFDIYQELCEKNLTAVYCVGEATEIVLYSSNFHQSEKEKMLEEYCSKINDAEFSNKKYAPFISEKIFENYKKLQFDISFHYTLFKFWIKHHLDTLSYRGKIYNLSEVDEILAQKQKEISELSDLIIHDLREYLSKFEAV